MPSGVEVVVVPATAQNVKEQHVRVTLVISLPPEYPDASPSITLRYSQLALFVLQFFSVQKLNFFKLTIVVEVTRLFINDVQSVFQ